MSYLPNTQADFDNPPQYIAEGTSASTFGTTPTSPTWVEGGIMQDISVDSQIEFDQILALGNYDILDKVKTGEMHAFTLNYKLLNTTMSKHGINAPVGAGTVLQHLSWLWSHKVDGTTQYVIATGARPQSTTLSTDGGAWTCNQTFICKDIAPFTTSAIAGQTLITPTETGALVASDAGSNAFTWNSVAHDLKSFSMTVAFGMSLQKVLGETNIKMSRPSNRRITWSAEVYQESSSIQSDYDAGTARAIAMAVESGTSAIAMTNARIESYSPTHSAASEDLVTESLSGTCEAVALT